MKLTAIVDGVAGLDDADTLRNWIGDRRTALVDLSRAEHIHAAVLQVLLASTTVRLIGMPSDPLLRDVLAEKLAHQKSATLAAMARPADRDGGDRAAAVMPAGALQTSVLPDRVAGAA